VTLGPSRSCRPRRRRSALAAAETARLGIDPSEAGAWVYNRPRAATCQSQVPARELGQA
jgi:hypothetical protein